MKTADFFYHLPPEFIAQQPAPHRAQARLMVVRRAAGACEHHQVTELPALLSPGDLLVVNDTRVIPARLYGRKVGTGGQVEILLVEETAPDIWEALLRASHPKPGDCLELAGGQIRAEILAVGEGRVTLRLKHERPLPEILATDGVVPLPPYIKRVRADTQAQAADRERYQTVYARNPGAVAAPTAGLHFTEALLATLKRQGVRHTAITLHVGPGTFQPVRTAEIEQHRMEAERYTVPEATARLIRETRAKGGRIVAVGSTVVRALETVAAEPGAVAAACGRSNLFIYPPYAFHAVDALLTNFHLPCSTLLMMVSAFAGYDLIRRAYQEAIQERYRFYSYGDCMLIL
ncbi:MAG: tRNA preQ1(34) S-adenosylmethionine ribosyltransferase-isomerase QueA [Lentisphaerae bacterium]|nr:tRNA preQ1(34) S-adenosylmethionine ribosyltransferase-isomerase QueA [Lentisphaerota bacterium]